MAFIQLTRQTAFLLLSSFFLLLTTTIIGVNSDVHDEFPEWDRVHWLVQSTDQIQLPCSHPTHYPYTNIQSYGKKIVWILPKPTSYQHLEPNNTDEGWSVLEANQNYTLVINKASMNVPESADGMYVCAALAKVDPDNETSNVYSWYYLRWGVGLYMNVPAMNNGSIGQKYYWCFTYAWVSCLVAIVIIILFAVTVHFRYRGGPVEESDEESVGLDGLSIEDEKKRTSPTYTTSSTLAKKKQSLEYDNTYGKV